jgi:hypothetical protein
MGAGVQRQTSTRCGGLASCWAAFVRIVRKASAVEDIAARSPGGAQAGPCPAARLSRSKSARDGWKRLRV